jgi:DNA-binding transcriptional ArsR family regulator
MARAAADSDVYNAIAEPRRRAILELVCGGEYAVGEVAESLGMDQPSVSKHLRVLRGVDLVAMRRDGRRRIYSADPRALDPIQAWVNKCERIWERHLDSIKHRAEAKGRGRSKETLSTEKTK